MTIISLPAITAETVLADVATLVEAKAIARDMRRTAIVVAEAHGEDSDIARSVSARYWAFVAVFIAMSLPFGAMWLDWVTVIRNATNASPLYSLGEASLLLVPVVAWWARTSGGVARA